MSFLTTNVAHAAGRLDTFIGNVDRLIINPLITLLFALAVVLFLFGMMSFFFGGDNEEKRSDGKRHMLWGVIGITIMLGVWTIMNLLISSLGVKGIDINTSNNTGTVNVNLPPL